MTSSDETQPLKVTIKPDKETYTTGDQMTLLYTIENISNEPAGYFKGSLDAHASNSADQPLKSYSPLCSQVASMAHPGEYILLDPKQKWEGKEPFGTLRFDEVQDYGIRKDKFHVANAIEYDGMMIVLNEGSALNESCSTRLLLAEPFDGKVRLSAKYCTDNPNYYRTDNPNYDRLTQEQEYKKRTKNAFIGCVDSNVIEISIERPHVGVVKDHDKDGKLQAERTYQNGLLNGTTTYYYPSSKVRRVRNYAEGKLNGIASDYFENGTLQAQRTFQNGQPNGVSTSYSKDGKLHGEASYKDGQLDGMVREYSEDGQLVYSATFKNGQLHGTEIVLDAPAWHAPPPPWWSNLLRQKKPRYAKHEANFREGKRDGSFKAYSQNGALESETIYKDDKLISAKEYDRMGNVVFDYDYTCDATRQETAGMTYVPLTAKMFLDKVEVTEKGVLILMKDTFRQRYKSSPVYVSKHFEGNRLFIPRNADLTQYRVEGLAEAGDLKPYAFIAAYREEDKESAPYRFLYFGKVEGASVLMVVREGNSSYVYTQNVYIDKVFETMKKCGGSASIR